MSYSYGMAALNLEMTDRVPRTEYSIHSHWALIEAVTKIKVNADSSAEDKLRAQHAFYDAWNFDFAWGTTINHHFLGDYYTDMGHAVYEQSGSDFREMGGAAFEDIDDVLAFDPVAKLPKYTEEELIKVFDDAYDMKCKNMPDAVNMVGTYITCMSGLIDMLGWDMLLMSAGVDAEEFGHLTERYAEWMKPFYSALAKCKSPVIMAHDDIVWTSGAFIAPEWYRRFLFPSYKKMFEPVLESGKKLLYTSDGTFTEFIDDIADCGVHGFVMEPTTDMQYIADKYGKTHSFVGNADTRILLTGTKEDIRAEVKRCMDIGKKYPGFFMAVGNHIPSNTPIDNCLWYQEFYMEMGKR